MLAKNDLQC